MDLGIEGRCAVVTGASKGIGRRAAVQLVEAGVSVLLVARGIDGLDSARDEGLAAAEKAGRSVRIETLGLDVTAPDAPERISGAAPGAIDILVNNAGVATWRPPEDVPESDWYLAHELYVMAPMRLMRSFCPRMKERGWGRVVNVASTAGKRPTQRISEYSVAKAGQLSLSRLFADTYAGTGVLVNAVCPGPVASEMWMEPGGLLDQSLEQAGHGSREEALTAASASRPIGRMAESEEIASAITFLCSERSSYVLGAAWSVDGGTVQVII